MRTIQGPRDIESSRATALRARAARAVARFVALIAVCVTCDASTALSPPEVRDVRLDWESDTSLVVGGKMEAAIAASIDGEPYAMPRLRLTSSDSSIVGISPDGRTLEGLRLGRATITVRLLSTSLATSPAITRQVVVSPAGVRLAGALDTLRSLGDTVRLAASAVDANDQVIPVAGVQWSSSDTAVLTVNALGLVTARRNGVATVRAAVGAQADSAEIQVLQRAAVLRFSIPQLALDALGAESTVVVQPLDARGGAILDALAPPVVWGTSAPAVAAVIDGRVSAVGNGSAWMYARTAGMRDSVRVDVAQRAARVVVETPSPMPLQAVGETGVARARSYDRRDNEVTSALPGWRSLNPLVAYVEARTGIVTALSTGDAVLVAEHDGAADTLVVTVLNAPAMLVLEPASVTMTSVGDTVAMRWSVRNSRGVEILGAPVTLASTDTAIVRPIADGRIVAAATGAARVIATTTGGVADTSLVTVINAVENVALLADAATLASVGDSLSPAADIRSARGLQLPRGAATWTSDDPGTARVTSGGIIIATGAGETVVRIASPTYPDRRDSLVVTVTNAPAHVTIERDLDTLTAIGASRAYSAEVRNGREALLAVTATWRTLDPAIARISTTGLATAMGLGTARLVATAGAVADTLLLTVRDEVTSLDVSPSSVTLTSIGDILRPIVLARNAIGVVVQDARYGMQSSDSAVVRPQGDSIVIAAAIGTARVVITSGRVSDTLTVTVSNLPVLIDIALSADTIRALGDSVTPAVVVRNARGDLLPRTTLTWSVDDPVVARVSTSGVVTARAVGSTWIRAAGGTTRDSMHLVVTNEVTSLSITLVATGLPATVDTMTAAGQSLAYATTATNALGQVVPGVTVAWRSTVPGVVAVPPSGVVTAMGTGSTLVIARAGEVEDTVRVVVIDPTRLYVDNAVVVPVRFGTVSRPYATIQDAINAAGVDDTVIVHRGNGYSEAVTLGRRVTVLGDSSAFMAGGRDPMLLPRLAHDLGAAGISSTTSGASYTIRYLGIQHSVDGDAIAIRDADNVLVDHVFVNPMPGFRAGRGIVVERATGSVLVARGRVDSVYAYGVRIVDAQNARVEAMTVRGVGARSGFSGAGVELSGGTGGVLTGLAVRRTAGPQVLMSQTSGASLLASALVGEQQLVRLEGVRGATVVRGNTFDVRRQTGEPAPARSAMQPDPSALEILGSAGVLVDANTFVDIGGQSSLMDGVRLADVRVGTSGAPYGALLTGNRFGGGRYAVRGAIANFTLRGARVDSAAAAVMVTGTDTVTLDRDTVHDARVAAVQSVGGGSMLTMTQSLVTGAQRAVVVTSAGRVVLRQNTITGASTAGLTPQPALGTVDVTAATTEIVANTITGVRGWAAVTVRGGIARVDSNFVSRNLLGLHVGATAAVTLGMRHNSLFDNDTLPATARRAARGLVNEGLALNPGDNWWGDPRGPSRNTASPPDTYGDSATGPGSFGFTNAPIGMHVGAGAVAELRKLGGDGQTGAPNAYSGKVLAVRVVDAQGRPLANATVTFRVSRTVGDFYNGTRSGNENVVTSTTDANGFAWAAFLAANVTGTHTITATNGAFSLTFTATVQ